MHNDIGLGKTDVNELIFIQHNKKKRFAEETERWLEEQIYKKFSELSVSFA
jgi:hypothetical protein